MPYLKIYTCNFGDYDVLHDPHCIDHEYACFTDTPTRSIERGIWRSIVCPLRQETPRLEARWYKTHSHEFYTHTEWTLYIDASLELHRCPVDFLEWCRSIAGGSDCDMYLFKHPERDCLYREAETCVQMRKDTPERIDSQVARYRAMDFPEHFGLWLGGVLWRRNTEAVKKFNEMWWWELLKGSHRDQISLPVVSHFSGVKFASLPHECFTDWVVFRADHSGRGFRH